MKKNTITIKCPFDETTIKEVSLHSEHDAKKMLQKANELFNNHNNWLPHFERIEILEKLAQRVDDEANEFAMLIASEGGKPLRDANVEVTRAIDGVKLAAKHISQIFCGEEIPMNLTKATEGRSAHTINKPIGVVLALSAFNHPLNLIIHQVIPAIAVGCPVIIKPASATPLCAIRLVELLTDAGLPKGWCQLICCSKSTSSYLARSNKINFMSFIGSAKVGWMLKSQLAPGVRCALEHGGVAPVIVDDTVKVEDIIPPLLKGSFYHAGQVCVSVQRIYAPESIAAELAKKLAKAASQLIVGDPRLIETEVGPLIKPSELDRIEEWITEAKKSGAKIITGGKKISNTMFEPTVLFNPPEHVKVSTSEVFGPVVSVYSYKDQEDALKRANQLPYVFQASIFSNDLKNSDLLTHRLNAATVIINDHTAFRADWMPFAGQKESGYGIGGIPYTMHDMVEHKLIVRKH